MPTIEFMAGHSLRGKVVEAPEGGDLLDICDEHFAPIPFSCRSATCATCHIEILEGVDLLEPAGEHEAELLHAIRAPEGTRLACQAVIRAGGGRIRLRSIDG